jgi:hypothetical protein
MPLCADCGTGMMRSRLRRIERLLVGLVRAKSLRPYRCRWCGSRQWRLSAEALEERSANFGSRVRCTAELTY